MAKKDFIARQAAVNHGYFEAGLQMGRQQILDLVSLVLRDPEIMGERRRNGLLPVEAGCSTCRGLWRGAA